RPRQAGESPYTEIQAEPSEVQMASSVPITSRLRRRVPYKIWREGTGRANLSAEDWVAEARFETFRESARGPSAKHALIALSELLHSKGIHAELYRAWRFDGLQRAWHRFREPFARRFENARPDNRETLEPTA